MQTLQSLLNQHSNHTVKFPNGDVGIKIGNNLMDVFSGHGWNPPARFRQINGDWVYQHGPKR